MCVAYAARRGSKQRRQQTTQQTTGKNSGSRKASGLLVPTERELSEILSSSLPFPALFSFVSRALVLSIKRSINRSLSLACASSRCVVLSCERPTYSHHHGGSADIVLWRASERRDHDSSVRGMGVRSTDWYGCDSCVCVRVRTVASLIRLHWRLLPSWVDDVVLTELASIMERSGELARDQRDEKIRALVQKYLPLRLNNPDDLEKDRTSHFILRLAYCVPYVIEHDREHVRLVLRLWLASR